MGAAAARQVAQVAQVAQVQYVEGRIMALRPKLFRICMSEVRNLHVAEDLAQDAFVKCWQARATCDGSRGDRAVEGWVTTIAVNVCRDWKRKRAIRDRLGKTVSWESYFALYSRDGDTLCLADAVPSTVPTPEERCIVEEEFSRVVRELSFLPDDYRAVIWAIDVCGLSYEEAAQELGICMGTVRSRLHRSRIELRKRLAEAQRAERAEREEVAS